MQSCGEIIIMQSEKAWRWINEKLSPAGKICVSRKLDGENSERKRENFV